MLKNINSKKGLFKYISTSFLINDLIFNLISRNRTSQGIDYIDHRVIDHGSGAGDLLHDQDSP